MALPDVRTCFALTVSKLLLLAKHVTHFVYTIVLTFVRLLVNSDNKVVGCLSTDVCTNQSCVDTSYNVILLIELESFRLRLVFHE